MSADAYSKTSLQGANLFSLSWLTGTGEVCPVRRDAFKQPAHCSENCLCFRYTQKSVRTNQR